MAADGTGQKMPWEEEYGASSSLATPAAATSAPWEQSYAEPQLKPPTDTGTHFTDYLKAPIAGAVEGVGQAISGIGSLGKLIAPPHYAGQIARAEGASPTVQKATDTLSTIADLPQSALQWAGNKITQGGQWIAGTESPGAQAAEARPVVEGSILHPSTLKLGEGATSPSTLALKGLGLAGAIAPMLIAPEAAGARALGAAGRGSEAGAEAVNAIKAGTALSDISPAAAQLVKPILKRVGRTKQIAGAGSAGVQMAEGAAQGEQSRIEQMPDEELAKLPAYQALTAQGIDPATARQTIAQRAHDDVFAATLAPSVGMGFASALPLLHDSQGVLSRVVGNNRLARAATGAALEAPVQGAAFTGQSAAGIAAANAATGENRSPLEDSAGTFGSGALMGGLFGLAGGLHRPAPSGPLGRAADTARATGAAAPEPNPGAAPGSLSDAANVLHRPAPAAETAPQAEGKPVTLRGTPPPAPWVNPETGEARIPSPAEIVATVHGLLDQKAEAAKNGTNLTFPPRVLADAWGLPLEQIKSLSNVAANERRKGVTTTDAMARLAEEQAQPPNPATTDTGEPANPVDTLQAAGAAQDQRMGDAIAQADQTLADTQAARQRADALKAPQPDLLTRPGANVSAKQRARIAQRVRGGGVAPGLIDAAAAEATAGARATEATPKPTEESSNEPSVATQQPAAAGALRGTGSAEGTAEHGQGGRAEAPAGSEAAGTAGAEGVAGSGRNERSTGDEPGGVKPADQANPETPPNGGVSASGVIDSVNPSGHGVFENYAQGREFRATARLADNMRTLAETEGTAPDSKVTLYRGVADGEPADGIRPGDFVTTNRQLAKDYAGNGKVVKLEARRSDVIDDADEPGGEEYIYRPAATPPAAEAAAVSGEGTTAGEAPARPQPSPSESAGRDTTAPSEVESRSSASEPTTDTEQPQGGEPQAPSAPESVPAGRAAGEAEVPSSEPSNKPVTAETTPNVGENQANSSSLLAKPTGFPVGGFHAVDDAGAVLKRSGAKNGDLAPRFATAEKADAFARKQLTQRAKQESTHAREPAAVEPVRGVGKTAAGEPDVGGEAPAAVEAAARESAAHPENERPEPTPAQHEAGNFKMGHVNLHGLDVSIEVPKGAMRRGTDRTGKPWERAASDHYGYVRGSEGADGEHVDVYLGPHAEDPKSNVFVIDQVKPGTKAFDEHKAMVGFKTGRDARASYDANFPKGLKTFGGIRKMSMDEFKDWVKNGDTTKPVTDKVTVAAAKPQRSTPVEQPSKAAVEHNTKDAGEELWWNRRNNSGKGLAWGDVEHLNATLRAREVVKSKVWPRPDYEKLIDEGMPTIVAHMVKQVYDGLAAKPRSLVALKGDEYRRYVEGVNKLRDEVFRWANAVSENPDVAKLSEQGASRMDVNRILNLGRDDYPLLASLFPDTSGGRNRFRYGEGAKENNTLGLVLGGNKLLRALQLDSASASDAREDIAKGWPAPQEGWERIYQIHEAKAGDSVYRDGARVTLKEPEFWVSKRGGRFRQIVADGFKTRDEAVAAAKEAYSKSRQRGGDGALPEKPVELKDVRAGAARRPAGEDLDSNHLKDTFGFKGVNFGNWMKSDSPKVAAERQAHLNHAYDSLMDLAELLDLPPKALSLDGRLGIAFGAQGHGANSGAAHFVPGVNEINLTREAGAGSLAHEWAHALDHYFATQAGDRVATSKEPFLTEHLANTPTGNLRPEIRDAFKTIVEAMNTRPETQPEAANRIQRTTEQTRRGLDRELSLLRNDLSTHVKKEGDREARLEEFDQLAARLRRGDIGEGYVSTGKGPIDAHVQVVGQLANLYKDATGRKASGMEQLGSYARMHARIVSEKAENGLHKPIGVTSEYAKQARLLEGSRKNPYWSTNLEKFARAFQSYVIDKLAQKEAHNHYLSRPQLTEEQFKALQGTPLGERGDRYPRGAERERIDAAFDTLIGALKTEEKPSGNVALFSRSDSTRAAYDQRIDALFERPDQRRYASLRVLDRADILDMLGHGDKPLDLVESAIGKRRIDGRGAHNLTAEDWKKVPEWIENPVAVFKSQTDPDRLVLVAPDLVKGRPVRVILEPNSSKSRMDVHVLVNAYDESGTHTTPMEKWWKDNKDLLYLNQKLSPAFSERSGLRLPGEVRQLRGYAHKVLTDADLVKYRANHGEGAFSNPPQPQSAGTPRNQIQKLVDATTAKWGDNQPRVRVVADAEGLPANAKGDAGYKTAEGYYDPKTGTAYLVASNLRSPERAMQVLAHEAIGHHGVENVVNDAFGAGAWQKIEDAIGRLDKSGKPNDVMRGLLQETHRRYPGADPRTFAKEFLAVSAEKGIRNTFLDRVVQAIRKFLRQIMPSLQINERELRELLAQGERFVREDTPYRERVAQKAAMAFSSKPDTFYSALRESVETGKGAPKKADATAWKQWLDGAQRRGEFKGAEREWMGLDQWLDEQNGPVTREALMQHVRDNQVRVQEVLHADEVSPDRASDIVEDEDGNFVLQGADGEQAGSTKFGEYTLPGGKNYRELLLTLPVERSDVAAMRDKHQAFSDRMERGESLNAKEQADYERNLAALEQHENPHLKEGGKFTSSHFDEPNILAHVRMDDRTGPGGEKILHVEEVQSDWHQAGRKRGYGVQRGDYAVRPNAARGTWEIVAPDGHVEGTGYGSREEAQRVVDRSEKPSSGVPNAPLKKTEQWSMLAMKRVLRYAAEHGYDKVTWTTGEQQAARYDLSKDVDRITVVPGADGTREVMIKTTRGGNHSVDVDTAGNVTNGSVGMGAVDGKPLSDLLGKEVAQKIMAATQRADLSGDGLKMGGEGMRAFYDKMLPNEVNKYVKKWGGRVGESSVDLTDARPRQDQDMRYAIYARGDVEPHSLYRTQAEADADLRAFAHPAALEVRPYDPKAVPARAEVHSVDITPAMRESVMQGQPLFSKADEKRPTNPSKEPGKTIQDLSEVLKTGDAGGIRAKAKDWLRGKAEDVRPFALGALQTRHLLELMEDVPALKGAGKLYAKLMQQMDADRQHLMAGAPDAAEHPTDMLKKGAVTIGQDLRKFAYGRGLRFRVRPEAQKLFDIMHAATIQRMDPARAYERLTIENAHGDAVPWTHQGIKDRMKLLRELALQRGGDRDSASREQMRDEIKYLRNLPKMERQRERNWPKLQADYMALPEEAKRLYAETRDWYSQYRDATEEALIHNIEALNVPETYRRSMVNRMRLQFEEARREGVYFPLNRDGDFWIAFRDREGNEGFKMFESGREYAAGEKKLRAAGFQIDAKGRRDHNMKAKDAPSGTFVRDIIDTLSKAGVSEKVQDEVYQTFLRTLPEMSMRKHSIHRRNIAGFSEDALRAFAKNSYHGAHQLARLRHAQDMGFALDAMKASVDNWRRGENSTDTMKEPPALEVAKADALVANMQKRHDWIMNPTDQRLANMVNGIGFIWYLGASPASALTNLSQVVQTTLPVLGAEHGWPKATRVLGAAWRDAARTLGHMDRTLTDPEERRAFMVMQQRGDFSKTQAHTLAGLAEGNVLQTTPAWSRTMNAISWMFHTAELVNREATGMAAYRLARAKGMDFNKAVEYASNTNANTNFDYSAANRPPIMQGNVPRIALQFKNYSVGMTWLFYRNLFQAMKAEDPETRRIARRTVTGILGMTAILAGATGLPVYNAVRMTANAANTLWGDDNEPWNFDDAFHRWLGENLGPDAARLIAEGPTNYLTGANLSSRTSLANLWIQNDDQRLEGADAYHALLENLAGPIGGIVNNWYVGTEDVRRGNIERGVERMLPTAVKNSIKAMRYAHEGVNSLRGDPIVPDVSGYEDFLQAIGFQPAAVASQYRINTAMKNYTSEIQDRRANVMNAYALAVKSGDSDDRSAALQAISKFNAAHPQVGITVRTLRASLQQRARLSAQAKNGVVLNRKLALQAEQYAGASQ